MIGFTAQRPMEVEGLTGAGHGQRSPERINHRNGYRDLVWETRAGTVELKIPKLGKGSYFPGFLEPRRVAEKAPAAVIREAYVQGARPARSTIRCKPWGCRACPRAGCAGVFAEIHPAARVPAETETGNPGARWHSGVL